MTLAGFILTLCAALMWALGNIATKKAGKADMLGLVVWGSLIPPDTVLFIVLVAGRTDRIHDALASVQASSVFAVIYLSFIATLVGYGLWAWLMSRHPAAQVAPFSLLIPVIGAGGSGGLAGRDTFAAADRRRVAGNGRAGDQYLWEGAAVARRSAGIAAIGARRAARGACGFMLGSSVAL